MNHRRVYIGDLPPGITENALTELLSQFGEIQSISLTVRDQQLHSFALIEMIIPDAAKSAAQKLNGYDLNGFRLIAYTVPPRSRPRSSNNANNPH